MDDGLPSAIRRSLASHSCTSVAPPLNDDLFLHCGRDAGVRPEAHLVNAPMLHDKSLVTWSTGSGYAIAINPKSVS